MHKLSILLFALAALCLHCEAKVFTLCGLVKELRRQNFPENQMRNWACLVTEESRRDTSLVSSRNPDGTRDWGLFQLNDGYWCSNTNTAGKDCNLRCADVITDDITKASTCAKLVYRRHGFYAWNAWKNKCNGNRLPDISKC